MIIDGSRAEYANARLQNNNINNSRFMLLLCADSVKNCAKFELKYPYFGTGNHASSATCFMNKHKSMHEGN
jgi:hypothetical protein